VDYQQALDYIHSTHKFGSKLGLENITILLDLMGNPQDDLRFIHVAGTNGKGSTSNYIASVLITEGYDVGLFTSPFLEIFNERIRLNGISIENSDLGVCTAFVKHHVDKMLKLGHDHPTEFEVITAVAFEFYKRKKVDFIVLEVGLGGRLDSTNVIKRAMVSVITPIGLDHTEYLGDTIDKIAFEKAGIIKEGCLTITSPQEQDALEAIRKKASDQSARLIISDYDLVTIKETSLKGSCFDFAFEGETLKDLVISMLGKHQVDNACLALTTLLALRKYSNLYLKDQAIYEGLANAKWAGRLEQISEDPMIFIDGAHNFHGAMSLRDAMSVYMKDQHKTAIFGMLKDKDVKSVVELFKDTFDKWILVLPDNPRSMPLDELEAVIRSVNSTVPIEKSNSYQDALHRAALETKDEGIQVCFGSLYFIGEIRKIVKKDTVLDA
jgi:dihydrofolate synthase/folylpolyglutamate synthase